MRTIGSNSNWCTTLGGRRLRLSVVYRGVTANSCVNWFQATASGLTFDELWPAFSPPRPPLLRALKILKMQSPPLDAPPHPCYTYVMFPHPSIPYGFPTPALLARWGRLAAQCLLAPIHFFATLVAVQKKNSPCEPNFENVQPNDITGECQKIGTKAEQQVAQHDRITNHTLRAFATSREPSSSPHPNLPAVSRHSPRGKKNIPERTQFYKPVRLQGKTTKMGKADTGLVSLPDGKRKGDTRTAPRARTLSAPCPSP